MARLPVIPEEITVHLGRPEEDAPNVTVSFPDYIKNVTSSEIYPTWPEESLRANIYAIVTFTLNRVYTEWYRGRGYDFDITNSLDFDQAYVEGRDIFGNISLLVDELFNDYVRREGSVEPLFTQFCNGTTATCDGLSQWGTVDLAKEGKTALEILQHYYGDDIEIVKDTPIDGAVPSYPGFTLTEGMSGNDIKLAQIRLNRISANFPKIPKTGTDGVYSSSTTDAVAEFQRVFDLPDTGDIDKATWYKINYIYNSVKKIAELDSEGLRYEEIEVPFGSVLKEGDVSQEVAILQYYLKVISTFYPNVTPVEVDGFYGADTVEAVKTIQSMSGLVVDGIVGKNTWPVLYDMYLGILKEVGKLTTSSGVELFPGNVLSEGASGDDVTTLQTYLSGISEVFSAVPNIPVTGYFGSQTKAAVMAFQRAVGLAADGIVGPLTWDSIAYAYEDVLMGGM